MTSDADKTKILAQDQETLNQELQRAKEQGACLIIIRGTPQGHRFFIVQDEMFLGRDPSCEITLSDQGISRKHAKIVKQGENHKIVDLGSANGTFLNDVKLAANEEKILAKEDMIKCGAFILKYLPAGELEILFYGALGSAAHTDALTKIYNKRYLMEALDAEFKRAKALHTDFSIIFFDLDHFKKINDTYGHDAGDFVLKEVTQLIRSNVVRPKDVFARYGGEEFVLLLGNTDGARASEMAERMRSLIETHPFIYEGKRLPVTSSFGLTELSTGCESSHTLLKQADTALYQAKTSGRNRVVVSS